MSDVENNTPPTVANSQSPVSTTALPQALNHTDASATQVTASEASLEIPYAPQHKQQNNLSPETDTSRRHGGADHAEDGDQAPSLRNKNCSGHNDESELSDPYSNVAFSELDDAIVVSGHGMRGGQKPADRRNASDANEDEAMEDGSKESTISHCPERKHYSIFNDLSESKLESADTAACQKSPISATRRKGVLLGTWRDSDVPDDDKKHAVIGFINIRDRLRTRIQPNTKYGESLAEDYYPLPPGPVKEYTRLRSDVAPDETEEEHLTAEAAAVKEAIRRVKENLTSETTLQPPAVAPAPPEITPEPIGTAPQPTIETRQTRIFVGPLPGTRPTRIFIGYWKPSSEREPKDRHAVYGILAQNDLFRAKVVRETRDGRLVDGNYPAGAGGMWIPYDEVELEVHLKALHSQKVKEYCRVRQYQLDHGETSAERIGNETKAVREAQTRANTVPYGRLHDVAAPTSTAPPHCEADGYGGRELRRTGLRPIRVFHNDKELRASRLRGEFVKRTNSLEPLEAARNVAAHGRADRHAEHKKTAAAASNMPIGHHYHTNGRVLFHEFEDVQRLNRIWARQEALRMKDSPDDTKIHDDIKFERKVAGPLMGKLVSQGTIINIEGEEFR
ncbi:hypothetical protein MAJ_09100, partial [Metarhizium majus ARSEF 297]